MENTEESKTLAPPYYIPFYTELAPDRRDSIYYCSRELLRRALVSDKVRFISFFDEEWEAGGEDYWKLPKDCGHKFVPVNYTGLARFPFGVPNASFMRIRKVQQLYHVLFSQQTCGSLILKKMLGVPTLLHPTIINWVHSDFNESAMSIYPSHKYEILCNLAAGWNIFHNEAFMKRTLTHMRALFSGSMIRAYMRRSTSCGALGIAVREMDAVEPFRGHEGKFVMVYGGRLSIQKGIDKMLLAAAKLVAMGVPLVFELFVTKAEGSSSQDNQKSEESVRATLAKFMKRKDSSFVNVHFNVPHADYYAMCKRADAFYCPSIAESYGISWVEQMYGGAVGVYSQKPWIKGILPDDYPYVARGLDEAVAMLHGIWKDGGKAIRERMRKFILEYHNNDTYNDKVIEHLYRLTRALKEKRKVTSWKEVMA